MEVRDLSQKHAVHPAALSHAANIAVQSVSHGAVGQHGCEADAVHIPVKTDSPVVSICSSCGMSWLAEPRLVVSCSQEE